MIHLSFLDIIKRMRPISLSEMNDIRLMNRIDTKYLVPYSILSDMMEHLENDFRIQRVNGLTVSRYATLYFDTADLALYRMHHNQKRPRQKIRMRTYLDTDSSFLEIKNKDNKGVTRKVRIQQQQRASKGVSFDPATLDFLARYTLFPVDQLSPHIYSTFDRITLVNNDKSERITIDTNLAFWNCRTGKDAVVPSLMIIELKQAGRMPSRMKEYLHESRILPGGMSKYCLGTILTDPAVKYNRFKAKIRYIQKLTSQNYV